MKLPLHITFISVLGLLLPPTAFALPYNYGLNDFTADVINTDQPGLRVAASDIGADLSFTLDDGESTPWFDALQIWTTELWVSEDDLTANPISLVASLDLGEEEITYRQEGWTIGERLASAGGRGAVTWLTGAPIVAAGRTFRLDFESAWFGAGSTVRHALLSGRENATTIRARLTQIASDQPPSPPVTVPDGSSTVVLLGAGLLACAFLRRRAVTARA